MEDSTPGVDVGRRSVARTHAPGRRRPHPRTRHGTYCRSNAGEYPAAMTADPDLRSIAEALNRIDQYASLGRGALARSRAVDAELTRRHLTDTPFQRGRLLSRLLREEVTRQFEQRGVKPAGHDAAEWAILYLRIHDGLSLRQIGERLGMPTRSVARYYARAKELLLDRVYARDEDAIAGGIYCPRCGTRSADNVLPVSFACTGCGAQLTAESDTAGAIRVAVRPTMPPG